MKIRLSASLVGLTQLLCVSLVLAEPDETQQAWLNRVDIPAGWDVAERVAGEKPRHHIARLGHAYHLVAADSVTVRVPAGERMGVYRLDGRLDQQEFEFSWSNGSGLFASLNAISGGDEQSLIAAPPADGVTLVRIKRKQGSEGEVQLALFTSWEANRLLAVSYRELLAPLSRMPKWRVIDGPRKYDYWRGDLDTPLQIEIDGATRIKIDSRLLLPGKGGPSTDSYRIHAALDGEPWRVIDLVTLLDTTAAIAVDGLDRPVGRPAFAYLDIPSGHHRLELRVRRAVLVRLLERQQSDDYLYAGNRPVDYPETVGRHGKGTAGSQFWDQSGDGFDDWGFSTGPNAETYLKASRIAKDNSHRLGGIGAIRPLAAWAKRYPGQAQYRSLEVRRRLEHTFYRDLLPQQPIKKGEALFAWFLAPRLQERPGRVYFPETYARSLADGLAGGFFTTIPSQSNHAQEFLIPENFQPHQLRFSVDRSGLSVPESFFVQLDDADPVQFTVENRRALEVREFRPNTGAIALALLQHQHDAATATLSGTFASGRAAAPLVNAGFLELPLTGKTRRVKVWRSSAGGPPLRIALAYRSSSWYQMSESGYLDLLQEAGAAVVRDKFRAALAELDQRDAQPGASLKFAKQVVAADQRDTHRDLINQWEPLMRFLYSRYSPFKSGVVESATASGSQVFAPAQEAEKLVRQAERADQSGDWPAALEKWNQVRLVTNGALHATARAHQINALQRLGNYFLAKQLLRHDFLYAGQAKLRQQALEQLIGLTMQENDREAELTLRVVAAIRNSTAGNLRQLAESFRRTGRDRFSMITLLSTAPDQRPAATELEVAYALGWWQWFEQALRNSPSKELNAVWQGYRRQSNGDYHGALEHWEGAGQMAQNLSGQLVAGLDIRHGIESPDEGIRRQSILRWEEWQAAAPGPKVWTEIPQSVTSHAGTRSVHAVALGLFSDRFMATSAEPVTVSVYGPMTLRFGVRPLHDSVTAPPVNDWISIVTDGDEHRYPIIDNRVSAGLRLVSDSGHFPGRRVEFAVRVPAGYHELQLRSQRTDVLVGVEVLRPRLPLAVLPPLNPYTVRSALAGAPFSRSPLAKSRDRQSVPVRVAGQYGESFTLALFPFLADRPVSSALTDTQIQQLRALGSDRSKSGTAASPASQSPSLLDQLTEQLWEAENTPDRHLAALTRAEALAEGHLHQPGVEPVLRRLRREASWSLVRSTQQSAGLRRIDFIGWHPEAPETRTRKAIMGLTTDDAQVISGTGTRVLSMYNLSPVELVVELSMHDVAYQPVQAMRVFLAWDDLPERVIRLSAKETRTTLSEKVGVGNHVLRIRLAEPGPNQFLRVRFTERRGETSAVASAPVARSYKVATKEQPLVLLQKGPTRLRIDEWRDGYTRVTYRTLGPGWQEVTIPVEPGREEALLRVFRRTLEPGRPVAFSPIAEASVEPVADPEWALADVSAASFNPPRLAPLTDELLDGTWSLLGGWVSRRIVDDEPVESFGTEKFITVGGAYRKFDARRSSYYYADSRLRLREQGNPTFATRGSVTIRRATWPLELDVGGSLFLQNVDASGRIESAATARARLSRVYRVNEKLSHRPSVSFFQRWLSMDELAVAGAEKVDQDIFTRYKNDHQRGVRIGDRIQHRPWLDTVLFAGAYVASNEDLNVFDPDHLGMNVGVRQLIRDVDLGIRYNRFEYFKDRDRNRASTVQRFRLDLGYTRWFDSRRGLRGDLSVEYDQSSGDYSVFLSFSLNRSKGRYFRDFRSSELDFLWLRERRLLEQQAQSRME